VDAEALRIAWRCQWLPLKPLELRMLRLLLGHPDCGFSRPQSLDAAHDDLRDVSNRAMATASTRQGEPHPA
jgi:two-component system, OmpR family, response regulator BaeR